MEFRQIRYALAVAKERSFTKAGLRLNVSQSAVSEQVKLLEARIGFDLFRRTGRGVEPTERGRMFLYEAERVTTDLLNLSDVARRLSGIEVESLIMGIGSGLAPMLLPRMFPNNGFPSDLHLEIRTAPTRVIFEELHNEHLDIGIAAEVDADRVPAGLSGVALFELDMILLLPPGHRLAAIKGAIDIGLLIEEPIIMNELSIGYGQIVATMFNDLGMRPRIRAVVDNVDTIKVMVQTGIGISLIPAGAVAAEAKLGLLEVRPISPARRITIAAFRSRQNLSRRKEALFKQLLSQAQPDEAVPELPTDNPK